MAALRVSQPYQPAVRYMWNDAMRDPIFSRTFSRRIAMEPIRVRGALRRHFVRHIRARNSHSAHAATAAPGFHATRQNIFPCLSRLCARGELDLFAAALAQLLNSRTFLGRPAHLNRRSTILFVHLVLLVVQLLALCES